jgi:hypothetical protein
MKNALWNPYDFSDGAANDDADRTDAINDADDYASSDADYQDAAYVLRGAD